MAAPNKASRGVARFAGLSVPIEELGSVHIGGLVRQEDDISVHHSDREDVQIKVFDLACGVEGEVSLGPYTCYQAEIKAYQQAYAFPALVPQLPHFLGASVDGKEAFAYMAQSTMRGQDLTQWLETLNRKPWTHETACHFRQTAHELVGLALQLKRDGLLLIRLRPTDVIHASSGPLKLNHLGGCWVSGIDGPAKALTYMASVDYSELPIDTMILQSEESLEDASVNYALGVGLFEWLSGQSRLHIDAETAHAILEDSALVTRRDTRIRDLWHQYPHLESKLPLLSHQLEERSLLFGDFWYGLEGYLAQVVDDWEGLEEAAQKEMLVGTGQDVIAQHLEERFQWMAAPMAHATIKRHHRLASVEHLQEMLRDLISPDVRYDLSAQNMFVKYLADRGESDAFLDVLNRWDVRQHPRTKQWTLRATTCCHFLLQQEEDSYVTPWDPDSDGQFYYHLFHGESDEVPIPVSELHHSSNAWIV
jgi:hypothetical protein